MKIETEKDRNSGSWVALPEQGRPEVMVHKGEGASSDDPVTLLWGGNVTVDRAMNFFQGTVGLAGTERPSVLRTIVFTQGIPAQFEDPEKLLLPEPVRSAARFVRFEHCVSRTGDEKNRGELRDADYIVWARLDETNDSTDDSIGVYVRPSRLRSIIPSLAEFVATTKFNHMSADRAFGMLTEFDKRLPGPR
jgi:hypothetical protein